MLTIDEAFSKFKSRLELNSNESKDASKKQNNARDFISTKIKVKDDFLTGSYARHTKTKPLKDVDIFIVLKDEENHWKEKQGSELLGHFEKLLKPEYGDNNVSAGRRAIQIRFHDQEEDEGENDKDVLSIDIIPAFEDPNGYLIPCSVDNWIRTNPEIHKESATEANKKFDGEWKPLVKMLKKWNEVHDKPIKPSFLVEVMALQLLEPPFSGNYLSELKFFFAGASARINDIWPDPAGLGPPVSEQMDQDRIVRARRELKLAEQYIQKAIIFKSQGKNGDALRVLRDDVFGKRFPLS